ncbi:UDP-N-acetylglucosamine 1-carboxyvinyltransferase [Helicobacter trogontum]|uniref:UDP-N-acetylglucosamine 1-carboxyvinyltransferase n=1 Tax=Helicobacter trogontum TaxID=50960 RepID=A0A4U8THF4_9HELI|nr:UDP-N-acetylglucosamine 1-carboxyvinyltransferase [Helicobacter trogontum]MCI5787471.1 UDP-N-acetylglucosamine 1-carboxyvinyltransferase [Helicobacter trogontum]MDY5186291.1 UDP-N-acetylglucosamine 1-carboxyvinyltransferase [Helicobacter trogontum]TLD99659.1 UDP-N-acetylglucosamine 1-carboxyvinyltransferase [Helicobacter trogontum]
MDYLEIEGGHTLQGSVKVSGAKNAALPLLALSLLAKQPMEFYNLPEVADINTFMRLLTMLGANITTKSAGHQIIDTTNVNNTKAVYDIVRKMRASILVLGPLLARFGHCEVSLPGGCAIGARPVDLHIKAMQKLGATVEVQGGYIMAHAKNGLKGADIVFDKITVTGTSNVIMAAALANGKTRIVNAAKEPEVVQLCQALQEGGLQIQGIGTSEIVIEGTNGELLDFKPTRVIPDRIEVGTYLCIGAITNSQITLHDVCEEHIESIVLKLNEIGFSTEFCNNDKNQSITLYPCEKALQAFRITTTEYPGFPTDMQAQFMALSTQCNGSSFIKETLFENRFMHVNELQRLGADIAIDGNVAQINGKTELIGADVMATDLRASSALVLAALVAKGITRIHRIYHLDRGYEQLEVKLSALGAKIRRLSE